MNTSLRRASALLAAATVALGLRLAYDRYTRQEVPRNTTTIVVFDQGHYTAQEDTDPWALPGWDWGLSQHRSLSTAGCHLFSYAHAIEWITGTVRGDDLLTELLMVCKNPSDQEENSHRVACKGLHDPSIYSKEAYDTYVSQRYNIQAVELEKDPQALQEFFRRGGAIVTFIPGHYITAVEAREIDGTLYVHMLDSNWGTARRKGYETFFLEEGDRRVRILATAEGTYTEGSDYWVTYDTFRQWNWKTPLLPGE